LFKNVNVIFLEKILKTLLKGLEIRKNLLLLQPLWTRCLTSKSS